MVGGDLSWVSGARWVIIWLNGGWWGSILARWGSILSQWGSILARWGSVGDEWGSVGMGARFSKAQIKCH